MNFILIILVLFFSSIQTIVGQSNCLFPFIKIKNNEFLVLSDNETDANTAREICSSSGGSLARITSQSTSDTVTNFLLKHLIPKDLSEVKIYKVRLISGYETFLFRKNNDGNPGTLESRPGRLNSFFLYRNKKKRKFSTAVVFCQYASEKSLISQVCNQDWEFNFKLHGGTNTTSNTIKLYVYNYNEKPFSSNLFLGIQRKSYYYRPKFIYIPDISVFIGARSDVNQNKWYWNNNTEVNNPLFPEPNSSLCQQMTWPLAYNDGINLRSKQCNKKAYFACQFTFEAVVSPFQCNGSFLQVSWKSKNLLGITRKAKNLMVQIDINGTLQSTVSFNDNSFIISGLQPRSHYQVKVSVRTNCSIILSSTSRVSTYFEIPESVNDARVVDTESNTQTCIIQWEYKPEQFSQTQFYEISGVTPPNTSFKIMTSSLQPILGNLQYQVDLSSFPPNSTVKFVIQAFSCEGGGVISNVSGSCITPLSSSSFVIIATIVGSVFGLLLLLVVGLCVLRRNKQYKTMNLQATMTTTENNVGESIADNENDNDHDHDHDENEVKAPMNLDLYENVENKDWESIVENENVQDENEVKAPINLDLYENVQGFNKKDEIKRLKDVYLEESLNSFQASKIEFDKICEESLLHEPKHEVASNPENSKKNRYRNIYPYDHSRVELNGMNYINASYIEGYRQTRSYIATQGPRHTTVNDFWEMVWKENSKIIVMLCRCVEKGKTKCETYWPTLQTHYKYGEVSVKCTSEQDFGGIIKRVFTVNYNQDERTITQFHYVSWPDHDIPLTTSGMYRLRNLVNNEHAKNQSKGRIIVHCSAGAGRTGTYIAIDNLIEEFYQTGEVDVYNAVMKMRRNRKDMVQKNNQYVFIKKILLEHLLYPTSEVTRSNLISQSSTTSWKDTVRNEYQRLFILTPNESNQVVESAYENYSALILSDDINQVKITNNNKQIVSTNAHYIEDDRYPSWFIASSAPKNAEQFLDVIKQTNSKIVVCLETLSSDPLLSILQRKDSVTTLNRFKLNVKHTTDHNNYVIMNVTVEEFEENPYQFSFVHFHSWIASNSPPDVSYFVDVITKIKTSMEIHDFSTALVYCSDGRSRTGLFLSLAILIEQIKSTDTVNVFRTVKDLREMRPGAFESMDDYFLCYETITKYCSLLL